MFVAVNPAGQLCEKKNCSEKTQPAPKPLYNYNNEESIPHTVA